MRQQRAGQGEESPGEGSAFLWTLATLLVLGTLAGATLLVGGPRESGAARSEVPARPDVATAPVSAEARGSGGQEGAAGEAPDEAAPAASHAASSGGGDAPEVAAEAESVRVRIRTEGALQRGETLAAALGRKGVGGGVVHSIAEAMAPVFSFRHARPGDRYRLEQDAEGRVQRFVYDRSPVERYVLSREEGELRAERDDPELARRRTRVAGVISTSLYESIASLGERPELAQDFAGLFAWDVDFARNVQQGDEFAVLYERLYLEREEDSDVYVRPGRILAARYSNDAGDHIAVYFEPEEGRGGYYRPDGSSVERQFLRAPLQYRRISSSFTHNRLHPILKVRRPHLGIDYAASRGTPVWAVADGEVVYRGATGGFGKLVKVRHANGYVSYYGHLSRFARDVGVGERVDQKQVIGYVGSTGLSTGPHLDFRIKKRGRYVDPSSLQAPAGDPVPQEARPEFFAQRDALLADLHSSSITVVTNDTPNETL